MEKNPLLILHKLTSLSTSADKITNKIPESSKILEWASIIKKHAQDIFDGVSDLEIQEFPPILNFIQQDHNNEFNQFRLSHVLLETKKQHLHKNTGTDNNLQKLKKSYKCNQAETQSPAEIDESKELPETNASSSSPNNPSVAEISKLKSNSTSLSQENEEVVEFSTPCNVSNPDDLNSKSIPKVKKATSVKRKSTFEVQSKSVKKSKIAIGTPLIVESVKKIENKKVKESSHAYGTRSTRKLNENQVIREIQKKDDIAKKNISKAKTLRQQKIAENMKREDEKAENAKQRRFKFAKEKCSQSKKHENDQGVVLTNKKEKTRSNKRQTEDNAKVLLPVNKISNPSKRQKIESTKSISDPKLKDENEIQVVSGKTPKSKGNSKSSQKVKAAAKSTLAKSKWKENIDQVDSVKTNAGTSKNETPPSIDLVIKSAQSKKGNTKETTSTKKQTKNLNEVQMSSVHATQIKINGAALDKTYVSHSDGKMNETTATHQTKVVDVHFKTPKKPKQILIESKAQEGKNSSNSASSQSYAMTPLRTSYVSYDISEIKSDDDSDEDSAPSNKPIPSWASGVHLRNALLHQHYHEADTDLLFGNDFTSLDLSTIMGIKKKAYIKRTSSANWNSPNASFLK